jgi:hypothetical protein
MSKTILENVILFARAGFRGLADATQVESVMATVAEAINDTELLVDGEAIGVIRNARVEGSLIRGDLEDVDTTFLESDAGQNLCRRIAASFEAPAAPVKKAAVKPAAKPVKKGAKTAAPPAEEEPAEGEEPADDPEPVKAPVKKTAPKVVGKPTSKPAPGKGKAVVPMNKKIKVNL